MIVRKTIDHQGMRQLKDTNMKTLSKQISGKDHLIPRKQKRDTIDASMIEEAQKEIIIEIAIAETIKLEIIKIMTTETPITQANQGLRKER